MNLDDFLSAVRSLPRLPGRLCGTHNARLFDDAAFSDAALELCARCPARQPCSDYAESLKAGALVGVVGGRLYLERPSRAKAS